MAISLLPRVSEATLSDATRVDHGDSCWPEEAFQRFFLENYSRLAGVVFRIVGDYSRAEELA